MRTAFYIHWVWYMTTLALVLYFKDVTWTPTMSTLVVVSNYSSFAFLAIYPFVINFLTDKSFDRHKIGVILSFFLRWLFVVSETIAINIFQMYSFPDKYLILAIGMVILIFSVVYDIKRKLDNVVKRTLI